MPNPMQFSGNFGAAGIYPGEFELSIVISGILTVSISFDLNNGTVSGTWSYSGSGAATGEDSEGEPIVIPINGVADSGTVSGTYGNLVFTSSGTAIIAATGSFQDGGSRIEASGTAFVADFGISLGASGEVAGLPPVVQFKRASLQVGEEENGGQVAIILERNFAMDVPTAVHVSSQETQSADPDIDFTPIDRPVNFAAGFTSYTLFLQITPDVIAEFNELVTLRITPVTFASIGATPTIGVTIIDNDSGPQTGTPGDDSIDGSAGNDTISGEAGNDRLAGGGGDDTAYGGNGGDLLIGGSGDDLLYGGAGTDVAFGGAGNDSLAGDADADWLAGGEGNDRLEGGGQDDGLDGGGGADIAAGGTGNDALFGAGGDDSLQGGADNDMLIGDDFGPGTGNDRLEGDAGDDLLFGGGGADALYGGSGNDLLFGGLGNDSFVFQPAPGSDTILDWQAGDRIDLTGLAIGSFAALTVTPTAGGLHLGHGSGLDLVVLLDPGETLTAGDFQF